MFGDDFEDAEAEEFRNDPHAMNDDDDASETGDGTFQQDEGVEEIEDDDDDEQRPAAAPGKEGFQAASSRKQRKAKEIDWSDNTPGTDTPCAIRTLFDTDRCRLYNRVGLGAYLGAHVRDRK